MQSLSKTQWFGLSFLVLHTIIVGMVYFVMRSGGHWETQLMLELLDYPFESIVENLSGRLSHHFPTLYFAHRYDFEYALSAILGGAAYYSLGIAIGFVMTLVEPKTQENLDTALDNLP